MVVRTKTPENPLKTLFEMDEGILKDPKKLLYVFRGVKRALQTTYHPDKSASGSSAPFSWEEANRLSAKINSNEALTELESNLKLLAGERNEKYDGERKEAARKVNYWVSDFQTPKADNKDLSGLRTKLEREGKRLHVIERERDEAVKNLRDLEFRVGKAESNNPNLPIKVKGGVESNLSAAEKFAIQLGGQAENTWMKQNINYAKEWARAYNDTFEKVYGDADFDKVFGKRVGKIWETYLSRLLSGINSDKDPLIPRMFEERLDNAVSSAKESGLYRTFKPKIKEAAKTYVKKLLMEPPDWMHESRLPDIIRLCEKYGVLSERRSYTKSGRYSKSHRGNEYDKANLIRLIGNK